MKYVINSQEHPIGKVKDLIYRVEFKIRGSSITCNSRDPASSGRFKFHFVLQII